MVYVHLSCLFVANKKVKVTTVLKEYEKDMLIASNKNLHAAFEVKNNSTATMKCNFHVIHPI